ncbi:MAG: 4'-phosphopantetheinyl transferase superfamily protein [Alphaproteobacteria bacterium]|nr:4'-phosphopantetheinyl transferase superfamily protein [Alphaproteobacteria bacterium]
MLTKPAPGTIHVWRWSLTLEPDRLPGLESQLAADERQRARRFLHDLHRDRFTAARVGMRVVLGRYLAQEPSAVRLAYREQGKPYLANGSCNPGLEFNLSHAGDMAVLAVATDIGVGIDIEYRRPLTEDITSLLLSTEEKTRFDRLPHALRTDALIRCWTRKEAVVKAIGCGLSEPLDQFEVTFVPDEPPRVLRVVGCRQEAAHWMLVHLEPAPEYICAVAARALEFGVDMFNLESL